MYVTLNQKLRKWLLSLNPMVILSTEVAKQKYCSIYAWTSTIINFGLPNTWYICSFEIDLHNLFIIISK